MLCTVSVPRDIVLVFELFLNWKCSTSVDVVVNACAVPVVDIVPENPLFVDGETAIGKSIVSVM